MRHLLEWQSFMEGDYDVFTNRSGEKFWGDVGAGVLPIAKSTGRILVGLRSQYVNEPGTWGVFGGKVDDSREKAEPRLAAERELGEEVGYDGGFEVVPAYVFKSPGGGFEYHNFVGVVDEEFEPSLDWETEDARWVTLGELRSMKKKHFGLEALLDNSMGIIEKYAR